jgi:2-methylcitrate dehydratase PrpD
MDNRVTVARALVRQWKDLTKDSIPSDVWHHGVMHIIDACGVGLAASSLEQGLPYARYAKSLGEGPASLLNGMRSCAMADAALINGGLIHSLEFDDTHTSSIVHGSAVLLPAALAVAQQVEAQPAQMVTAYIKAYEVLIRIGLAGEGGFQKHGFQITSVAGTLVTALLACDLMGADEDTCVYAIGIALSQSSGVFEFLSNGSTVKSFHPGWSAHAGLVAASMACAGLQGPETALEGTRGLYQAFTKDSQAASRFALLMDNFGSHWHVRDLAIKLVPSCHYLHGFVEAAGEAMEQVGNPNLIDHIEFEIAEATAPIVCEPWDLKQNPQTGHAIRWSLPVIVALRILEGKVDLDSFLNPPSAAVRFLAERMTWTKLEPHFFPQRFEAKMNVHLTDKRKVQIYKSDVLGNASRPASDEMILQKFRSNAARILSGSHVETLLDFWLSSDHAKNFQSLKRVLSAK